METTPVPTEHRTETPNFQAESFMTSHVIIAPTAIKGAAPGVSPATPDSSSRSDGAFSPIENEETLWEGRYSPKNFLGRAIWGGLFLLAWVGLALATWSFGYTGLAWLAYGAGAVIVLYWLTLAFKLFRVRRNHYYRLTTHRLFLTTGLFDRRVDQVELVRVKDLFVQQTLIGAWLDVGTVILISSEQTLPKAHLLGIEEPKRVRDLIWRNSRVERDARTSEVSPV
jgi:membrane protein YdbS with pleckstrin-like domain